MKFREKESAPELMSWTPLMLLLAQAKPQEICQPAAHRAYLVDGVQLLHSLLNLVHVSLRAAWASAHHGIALPVSAQQDNGVISWPQPSHWRHRPHTNGTMQESLSPMGCDIMMRVFFMEWRFPFVPAACSA